MKTAPAPYWLTEFRARMAEFAPADRDDAIAVSIKLRVESGCFCKSCCAEGHRQIGDYVRQHPEVLKAGRIVEHESGPEILTYMNLASGVFSFAAAVIALIVAIVQARAEGAKRGDKRGHPFRLIVRRIEKKEFREDMLLEIPPDADIDPKEISRSLLTYAKGAGKAPRKKPQKPKKKG